MEIIGRLRSLHTLDLFACQQLTDEGVLALGGGEGGRGTQGVDVTAFSINFAYTSPRVTGSAPPSAGLSASTTLSAPFSAFHLTSRHTSAGKGKDTGAGSAGGSGEGAGFDRAGKGTMGEAARSGPREVHSARSIVAVNRSAAAGVWRCAGVGDEPIDHLEIAGSAVQPDRRRRAQTSRRGVEGKEQRTPDRNARRTVNVSRCQAVTRAGQDCMRQLLATYRYNDAIYEGAFEGT